jgi:hypothetical protein
MQQFAEWQALLEVQAGAAATLTGLVFVAASINLNRIVAVPSLPGRVAESLYQFLQVFFIATAVLIPRQPPATLAAEIVVLAGVSWVLQVAAQVRYARSRSGHPRRWLLIRMLHTQFASIPFFAGAAALFRGNPFGIYWVVAGFVFSFIAGIVNSWVLLIEIVR